ncbi:HlyU family transcriptional regulator [Marinobacterium jannaschii]|uniref:HlyU family transcriptional regulator n=1 Tax=Marinobacterium jannaschii TaxID=64970 RepID=UPI00047FC4E9|nr:HlyU family transcriptional regulator [Marinobacterium jannaschii]
MGLFSALKSMFSGAEGEASSITVHDAVEYNGFEIVPMPQKENGQYRVNGIVRKGDQEHRFIRSDLVFSEADCVELTVRKARTTIDQMGDKIFS